MEQKFYYKFDMRTSKFFMKDKFGTKRLLKTLLLPDKALILLNFNYARHLGYRNLDDLLKANNISRIGDPLYHDFETGKVFTKVKDTLVDTIKKDPDFKLTTVFSQPNLTNPLKSKIQC